MYPCDVPSSVGNATGGLQSRQVRSLGGFVRPRWVFTQDTGVDGDIEDSMAMQQEPIPLEVPSIYVWPIF